MAIRESNFDNGAIAGFWEIVSAKVRESVVQADINGDGNMDAIVETPIMLFRRNDPAVREVIAGV